MEGKVLVTGASSGIGEAICKRLEIDGYEVYGVGRKFKPKPPFMTLQYYPGVIHEVEYDLMNVDGLGDLIKELESDGTPFDFLINNAGVAYYGTHETLKPSEIHEMVVTNLEVPMVLSNLLLKGMKTRGKGTIINIASVTADKSNTYGCTYGATKAGLASFGQSLFDEARKTGVKVVTIKPDMTDTNLYRNANFKASGEKESSLYPEDIAEAVVEILHMREGINLTEMTISPQKHMIVKK